MLTWILAIIATAILAVLGLAASRPASFRVERSAQIAAAPDKIFSLIDDFHAWPRWSPWEKLDPAMTRSHSGNPSGVGAVYGWSGNKKVGQGRMEITEAERPSRIGLDLEFMAPWKARNRTEFLLRPTDGGTSVSWIMTGSSPFMFRLMGLFMNMDRMIGKDFEAGLANLRKAAEA